MKSVLDIKELDKVEVFRNLYNMAMPYGMGWLQYESNDMNQEEAERIFKENITADGSFIIDYCKGRAMKVIIRDNKVDVTFYNQYHGAGRGEAVVNAMLDIIRIKNGG